MTIYIHITPETITKLVSFGKAIIVLAVSAAIKGGTPFG